MEISKKDFLAENAFNVYLNMAAGLLDGESTRVVTSLVARSALKVVHILMDVFVVVLLVASCLHLCESNVPIAETCITVFTSIAILQAVSKFLYFFARRKKIKNLINMWEESFLSNPESGHEQQLMANERYKVKCISVVMLIVLCLCTTIWCLLAYVPLAQKVRGGRFLPAPFYSPFFDPFASPTFEIIIFLESISAWLLTMKSVAFDGFFISLVTLEIVHYQNLKMRMETLFAVSEHDTNENQNLDETKERVNNASQTFASELSEMTNQGPSVDKFVRKTLNTRLIHNSFAKLSINNESEVKIKLNMWSKHHQQADSLVSELNDLYSPILLMQFFYNTIQMCFTPFVIMTVPLDMMQYITCVLYTAGNFCQLYLLCHYGDRLTESSSSLVDASLANGWHKGHSKQVISNLNIISIRLQTPQKIMATIFPLSSKTFVEVIRGTISYLMLLLELYNTPQPSN